MQVRILSENVQSNITADVPYFNITWDSLTETWDSYTDPWDWWDTAGSSAGLNVRIRNGETENYISSSSPEFKINIISEDVQEIKVI